MGCAQPDSANHVVKSPASRGADTRIIGAIHRAATPRSNAAPVVNEQSSDASHAIIGAASSARPSRPIATHKTHIFWISSGMQWKSVAKSANIVVE